VTALSVDALALDPRVAADELADGLRAAVRRLGKRGAVVAVSGGVDSGVVLALCAEALGADRTLALALPEADCAPETTDLGRLSAETAGVRLVTEDITPILEAAGCYRRRDEALRRVVPGYGPGWRAKLVLPGVLGRDVFRLFSVVAESPSGERVQARLGREEYLEVVAATNFKQRTRKMLEYYHADRLDFAVAGTPNRLEYDQGFFVKNGDGSADVKPIAHLYKSQVYQLAEYLGVPAEIRARPPTTDTYPLSQTQEEFYFSVPYETLDLCLYARHRGLAPGEVADAVGLSPEDVERVFRDIDAKRRAARYLHLPPQLLGAVGGDGG
jgi:NAD+ synthase